MKKHMVKSLTVVILVFTMLAAVLAGCSKSKLPDPVDHTATGLVLNGEDKTSEFLFYKLYQYKYMLEYYYSITDWSQESETTDDEGNTVKVKASDELKEMVETETLFGYYLEMLAEGYGVELTDEDRADIKESAESFMQQEAQEVIDVYGFTEEWMEKVVEAMYIQQYAYDKAIEENVENLTEEQLAQTDFRTVKHILISTVGLEGNTDDDGNAIEYTDEEIETYKAEQLEKAKKVLAEAQAEDADFDALIEEYTEDNGSSYTINSSGVDVNGNSYVSAFVEGAFALKEGEISDLVETEYGYHILYCVNEYDEAAAQTVMEQYAYAALLEAFDLWVQESEYEFTDLWKNYVPYNPGDLEIKETEAPTNESEEEIGSSADDGNTEDESADESVDGADESNDESEEGIEE